MTSKSDMIELARRRRDYRQSERYKRAERKRRAEVLEDMRRQESYADSPLNETLE